VVRIAVDAMGGDNAPDAVIQGSVQAIKENQDLEVVLFGQRERLEPLLGDLSYPKERLQVSHCSQVISSEDQPVMAVRRKQDSSMICALKSVCEGDAEGFVSAGNTGALMAGSVLYLGRLQGVERPALSTIFPAFTGDATVVLDVGASMDPDPEHLLTYALMGRLYSTWVLNKEAPKVGLLNVGTESNKGNAVIKQAFQLLREREQGFAGNTEARDVLQGVVDVLVCDGFAGNVLLKAIEGIAGGLFTSLKEAVSAGGLRTKLGGAMMLPALSRLKQKLDQETYGGAPLLGVGGVVIKVHGASGRRGVKNALVRQAYPLVKNKLLAKISSEIKE